MTQLGELSLWIALLMAAWCTTLATQGAVVRRASLVESGARGLYAALFFAIIAAAGLTSAFVTGDYAVRYVALHSSQNVELYYKICAFWSGREGELLFGSLAVAAAGTVAAIARSRDADRQRAAWTVAVLGAIVAACLATTAFGANPFVRLPRTAGDGRGLDPLLRNPAMAVELPLMLAGCAVAASVAALLAAGLIRRNRDSAWLARVRGWALVAWGLLSASLLTGLHWAYVSPGVRLMMERRPSVVAGGIAWIVLTVCLVVGELWRRGASTASEADVLRRRAGRVLGGMGVALCALVLAVGARARDYDVQIGDGEVYRAKDAWGHAWTFTSQGASRLERQGDDVIAVALLPTRDGVRQKFIAAESRQYYGAGGLDIFPAQAVPGIQHSVAQDVYVVLADAGDGRAVMRISFKPFIELGWTGGVFLALSGVLLFWPRTEKAT